MYDDDDDFIKHSGLPGSLSHPLREVLEVMTAARGAGLVRRSALGVTTGKGGGFFFFLLFFSFLSYCFLVALFWVDFERYILP